MYIYLISISLSLSLSLSLSFYLNGEWPKMKILQILWRALRLRYLSQSNFTLFKVTRFIYYKVNSKNIDNLSEILCSPASLASISLDLLIENSPGERNSISKSG